MRYKTGISPKAPRNGFKATRAQPERDFHKQVAAYLNSVLPEDCFWTTFPAGGGGKIRGAQLKAMGLQAGVPDILIIYEGDPLFVELKAKNGRVSEAQLLTKTKLENAGAAWLMCRDLAAVEKVLLAWRIPLTGRLAA